MDGLNPEPGKQSDLLIGGAENLVSAGAKEGRFVVETAEVKSL